MPAPRGAGMSRMETRPALAGELGGDGVRRAELTAPVSAADGDDVELGEDHGSLDGVRNLLARLDAEADVAVFVADDDESLEPHALTRGGLLLHGHDLHNLVGELAEEVLDDLVLLDGNGEEVDLLEGADLTLLDQAAELGARGPAIFGLGVAPAAAAAASAIAASAVTAAAIAAVAATESAAEAAASFTSTFSHGVY